MKGKNMVKDKKKAADPTGKKSKSAYQTGKTTSSKIEIGPAKKQ